MQELFNVCKKELFDADEVKEAIRDFHEKYLSTIPVQDQPNRQIMISIANRTYVDDPAITDPTTAFIYYDTSTFETFLIDFSKEIAIPLKTPVAKPSENLTKTAYDLG